MFSNLKYILVVWFITILSAVSAQKVVMKYDADMMVQGKSLSGILIHSVTDSSNRFIYVSKLGLKFFDVEAGKTDFSYKIHYFSPAFKSEKRLIGIAKEMFVLGLSEDKAGQCNSAFGLFGKRIKVCHLDSHITVACKFYPVSFDLRVLH
jgi:hypothetical protein